MLLLLKDFCKDKEIQRVQGNCFSTMRVNFQRNGELEDQNCPVDNKGKSNINNDFL